MEKTISKPKPTRSLKQVNKAIQELFPTVELVKGEGYFYLTSDDDPTGLELAMLYEQGIYVAHLKQQTVDRWVQDVIIKVKHARIPRTPKAPERVPEKGEDEEF